MTTGYFEKIMHNMNCVTDVCSREKVYMLLVGQVSELVEKM